MLPRRSSPWLLAFVALTGVFSPALKAQERPDTTLVTVTGTIVDLYTRQPVRNVMIQLPDLDITLFTDSDGLFTLPPLRRGAFRMVLRKLGYAPTEGDFTVDRGGSFELALTPDYEVDPSARGSVLGWVTDGATGAPLESAVISLVPLSIRRLSDARGWFDLGEVPGGGYVLAVESLGHETRTDSIRVLGGRTLEVRVALYTEPIELEGITVIARSRFLEAAGFFRRQGQGYTGRQWTAEEIEMKDRVFVEDLVTELIGVRRGRSRGGQKAIFARGGASSGACALALYIDDVLVNDPTDRIGPHFDLDLIDPRHIEALEVYYGNLAEMPAEYGLWRGHCGVILVWLKH
ncbi:MAG: carboxypeptidase-like regulatory domain-containing protein [Gemmatimonadetes bacterium]|nr:carboxypeptidase-like regulatory domain-containing protein [Gemmatimonadota bacterium]